MAGLLVSSRVWKYPLTDVVRQVPEIFKNVYHLFEAGSSLFEVTLFHRSCSSVRYISVHLLFQTEYPLGRLGKSLYSH